MPLLAATSAHDNREWTTDARFARAAQDVNGFGGMFLENGVPTAYLVDLGTQDAARSRLVPMLREMGLEGRGITFRQGQYDWRALKAWGDQAIDALSLPGVVYTDLDESRNRLTVGIDQTAARPAVEADCASWAFRRRPC